MQRNVNAQKGQRTDGTDWKEKSYHHTSCQCLHPNLLVGGVFMGEMMVHLAYGQSGLDLEMPSDVEVITPLCWLVYRYLRNFSKMSG